MRDFVVKVVTNEYHASQSVLALVSQPGRARDAVVAWSLVATAFVLWRWLYWPALRPYRGRHR